MAAVHDVELDVEWQQHKGLLASLHSHLESNVGNGQYIGGLEGVEHRQQLNCRQERHACRWRDCCLARVPLAGTLTRGIQ